MPASHCVRHTITMGFAAAFALAACGEAMPPRDATVDRNAPEVGPRPDEGRVDEGLPPYLDVPAGSDARPTGCVGWCTFRLAECGSPAGRAMADCTRRCTGAPASAAACLEAMVCVDVAAAFAANREVCELPPLTDGGPPPPPMDAGRDAAPGMDAAREAGMDAARVDAGSDGARSDGARMDAGAGG